jgi:mono/diheme cytochrome c family protein
MGQGRRGFFLLLGALLLLEFVAGCHGTPALTPQQLAGQRLYQGRCAHCHEENDLALKPPPPPLTGLFERSTLPSGARATDLQVGLTVLNGKGKMPAFQGRFTQEQLDALMAYLHTGPR